MIRKITLASVAIAASAFIFTSCEKEDTFAIPMELVQVGVTQIQGTDGKTYDVVDLGMPSGTMWATCNLGATSPELNGNYYSWGETEPKAIYSLDTYKYYHEGDPYLITKYCSNDERGYVNHVTRAIDKKSALDDIDNAAIINMGAKWNIPTLKEYSELLYRTSKRWGHINGSWGYLFTSTQKGYEDRSIFIPMAGQADDDAIGFIGQYGFYWTRTIYSGYDYAASILQMDHKTGDNITVTNTLKERYMGLPIRPVINLYEINK